MKDKNLPDDNNFKSLEELTNNANDIIKSLVNSSRDCEVLSSGKFFSFI